MSPKRKGKGKQKKSQASQDTKALDNNSHDGQKAESLVNQPCVTEEQQEESINNQDLELEKSTGQTHTEKNGRPAMPSESRAPDVKLQNQTHQHAKEMISGILPVDTSQFLSFEKTKFPVSPGYGTAGRKINLIANIFKLQCNLTKIYHYDVEIDESKGKSRNSQAKSSVGRQKCKEIFALFVEEMRKRKEMSKFDPVYDGNRNFYAASELPFKEKIVIPVSVEIDGSRRAFTVTVKPVKKVDGTNVIRTHALQNWSSYSVDAMNEILLALNTILNCRDASCHEVKVGRSFFSSYGEQNSSIGDGLEIWRGYNQSVHITEKGPAVILNLSSKVFHKKLSVIEYVNEVLNRDVRNSQKPLAAFEISKIENALKGVRVHVTHLPYKRKYYIKNVSKSPADEFPVEINGTSTTVAQYFKEKYSLRYPHLHCLQMRTNSNKTYLPFEVCEILEGQPRAPTDNSSDAKITAKVITCTAVQPESRFRKIEEYAKTMRNEQIKKFSLFMDLKPLKVQGRVIAPPLLKYNGQDVSPTNGTWQIKGKFVKSLRNESWIVLHFADKHQCSNELLRDFARKLENTCHSLGLILGKLKGIHTYGRHVSAEDALRKDEVKTSSLVIIVLSKMDKYHNYDEIKFIADYGLQLITQCILDDALHKLTESLLVNISLKINAKLGGVNHQMVEKPQVLREPVIIFGADVVHSTMCPSIAAVVGSLDAFPSKYKVSCRVQENKKRGKKSQEIILDLEDMAKTILKAFLQNTNGKAPRKIVFFRDGVSEGQFEAVRNHEVNCMRKASSDVLGHCVPMTFVVVQKRHQTRLRPENLKEGIGNSGNVPPGTTVDRDITYPNSFDYYLCSHEGLRGTSKPSRYTVLFDENHFSADELQKLSFHMCHMYARCTKSVSIPAPVKYADLAAYRAKKYADFILKKYRRERKLIFNESGPELPDFARNAINKMEDCKNHLFFV